LAKQLLYQISEAQTVLADPYLRLEYEKQNSRRTRKRSGGVGVPERNPAHRPFSEPSDFLRTYVGIISIIGLLTILGFAVSAYAPMWRQESDPKRVAVQNPKLEFPAGQPELQHPDADENRPGQPAELDLLGDDPLKPVEVVPARPPTEKLELAWDGDSIALEGHTDQVTSLAFAPNGEWFATGSQDKTIRLWDTATGAPRLTLTGHTDPVQDVAVNSTGTLIASAGGFHTGPQDTNDRNCVKVWNAESGTERCLLKGHTDSVCCVAFSPRNSQLTSGSEDGTIKVWDVLSKSLLQTLPDHLGGVRAVAFSPDGQLLASAGVDQKIRVWNTTSWELSFTIPGHSGAIECVRFSSDGMQLATCSEDKSVKLWDVQTHEALQTLSGHSKSIPAVAMSPNQGWIASGGRDSLLKLWDAQTGDELQSLPVHSRYLRSDVQFSPDGQLLASSAPTNNVILWRVSEFIEPDSGPTPDAAPTVNRLVTLLPADTLDAFTTYIHGYGFDHDPDNFFRLKDGELHINGGRRGFLTTKAQFADFRLVAEYQIPVSAKFRNSGVIFNVQIDPAAKQANSAMPVDQYYAISKALRFAIRSPNKGKPRIASGYLSVANASGVSDGTVFEGPDVNIPSLQTNTPEKLLEWNQLEIISSGGIVEGRLNGLKTFHVAKATPDSGSVSIQMDQGDIIFRRLEIHPLEASPTAPEGRPTVPTDRPDAIAPTEPIILLPAKDLAQFEPFYSKPNVKKMTPEKAFRWQGKSLYLQKTFRGHMFTLNEYRNYRLELQYRWTDIKDQNEPWRRYSRILFNAVVHSPDELRQLGGKEYNHGRYNFVNGYYVTLSPYLEHPDEKVNHHIWGERVTLHRINDKDALREPASSAQSNFRPAGRWNTLEVISFNDRLEMKMNGTTTFEADKASRTGGRIGIETQREGITFRKMIIHPYNGPDEP
jgi:WD40 repeat protein